ncbi:MAG: cytochrome C, partial [Bacteroidetes bacterium]
MKKFLRPALIALLGIFVVIQFIRPAPNNSGDESKGIATKYPVPADVQTLLKTACNDCHSNSTVYPWYAGIQPVAWWLDDHIRDGKRHLNFSTFTSLPIAVQNHKFEE